MFGIRGSRVFGFMSRQKPGQLRGQGDYSPGEIRRRGREHAAKKVDAARFLEQLKKQALIQCQECDGRWTTHDEQLQIEWANQRQAVYNGFERKERAEAGLSDAARAYVSHYNLPAPAEIPRIHGRIYYFLLGLLAFLEAPINFLAFQPLAEQSFLAAVLLTVLVTGGVMVAAHVVGIYMHRMMMRFPRFVVLSASLMVLLMVAVVAYLRYEYFEYETMDLSVVILPPLVVATLFFVVNMVFFGAGLLLSYALHEPLKVAYFAALRERNGAIEAYDRFVESTNNAYMARMQSWRQYQKEISQFKADFEDACGLYCTAYGEVAGHPDIPTEGDWPKVDFEVTHELKWPTITGQERTDEQMDFSSRVPMQAPGAQQEPGEIAQPEREVKHKVPPIDVRLDQGAGSDVDGAVRAAAREPERRAVTPSDEPSLDGAGSVEMNSPVASDDNVMTPELKGTTLNERATPSLEKTTA